MTLTQKRSKAVAIANTLRAREGWDFGEALRRGWEIVRLLIALKDNVLIIYFRKADGTKTNRLGTLNSALLPERKTTNKPGRKKPAHQIPYYELPTDHFKSFVADRYLGFEVARSIKETVIQSIQPLIPAAA